MTAPAPAPKTPYICAPLPTLRVLDRLQKTELGSPENRLCIGCFKLAFHDGVLLIENGSITHHTSNLTPHDIRVVLGEQQLLIDMWPQSSSSVTMTASPAEMEAARTYFASRGVAVCVE